MSLTVASVLNGLFNVMYVILLARIIISWFPARPGSIMIDIYEVLYAITEPLLGPLRRIIPPLGMIDLSPLIMLLLLRLLRNLLLGMLL